jgi:DNA repair protein RadA/Sms
MRGMSPTPKASKPKITFLCQDCGHTSPKWDGRCPGCNAWGTYVEFSESRRPAVAAAAAARRVAASPGVGRALVPGLASAVTVSPLAEQPGGDELRVPLGMPELDRLLGGGIVVGSVMLLAGDPGIGKSTLLLQAAARIANAGDKVLYVSGEESGAQVRMRASRIGAEAPSLLFAGETNVESVIGLLESERPQLVIIDSIQTLYLESTQSGAGSVAQVRDCAQTLLGWAKASGVPLFLAGHVTKDGNIAGPRVLEHMVDVVLYMDGDEMGSYRMLRCTKNRFGSTNDVALLEMRGDGLAEVNDPSAALIAERQRAVPGSAVIVTMEGSRPLLSEVQALTNMSAFAPPRRTANGMDFNRMAMISAVLTRRSKLPLGNQDIMVNVPGGLKVNEPAGDLGLALAMASSYLDVPLDPDTVFLGEVGLNGEIRRIPQVERRLAEAVRHGFKTAVVPKNSASQLAEAPGLRVVGVDSLRQAMGEVGLGRRSPESSES